MYHFCSKQSSTNCSSRAVLHVNMVTIFSFFSQAVGFVIASHIIVVFKMLIFLFDCLPRAVRNLTVKGAEVIGGEKTKQMRHYYI